MLTSMRRVLIFTPAGFITLSLAVGSMAGNGYITTDVIDQTTQALVETFGENHRTHIDTGVRQAAEFWRENDGTPEEFTEFCQKFFITDPDELAMTTERLDQAFASVYGHLREMGKDLRWHLDVDTGPMLPVDYALARLSLWSHVDEDLFKTKIAFLVLLNYPRYSLQEKLAQGPHWTPLEWAQARLADQFTARVPAEVSQKVTETYIAGDTYISQYNIFMHHLLTENGERPFPEGLKLISHWNLRDELKALYSESDGLPKQEMIYQVMLHIIRQDIPEVVINNPGVDWHLSNNTVTVSPVIDGDLRTGWEPPGEAGTAVENTPEPDTRYQHLLDSFHAQQLVDPYYPSLPTLMDRRFQRDREMPEAEVESLLVSILSSNVVKQTGKLIAQRLGRDLRPFDIWYDGFKARGAIPEEELDRIVGERYASVEAFRKALPNILHDLGFADSTVEFLTAHVSVDPSRGAGHAAGPGRKVDSARLRTRLPDTGMDYKGYNIAIHEFGHNVEQIFSLHRTSHALLRGVPNTAFTEGFAFVFQSRDLELLGMENTGPKAEHLNALDNLWSTYEIGGVALVDMRVWRWMYAHPKATASELKEAVIAIAKDVWNEYFAPVFGVHDCELLAVYSHMIDNSLYLPNYPLGHIIAFQIEDYMKDKNLATEMERMCAIGSVTPEYWMREAVGEPISTEPMIAAAERALAALHE